MEHDMLARSGMTTCLWGHGSMNTTERYIQGSDALGYIGDLHDNYTIGWSTG